MPTDSWEAGPLISALYCPADRVDRCLQATRSGADLVIADLEDSVAPDGKQRARDGLLRLLEQPTAVPVCPRINAVDSPWFAADVAALAGTPNLTQVMLPKVQAPQEVAELRRLLPGVEVRVLVETAVGVTNMPAIAAADGVLAATLGEADLRSDLGVGDAAALDPIRIGLVVACRAARLPPPMMSVFPQLADEAGMLAACRRARGQGFVGAQVIHPRQLPLVLEAFTPSAAEVADAEAVLAALADATATGSSVAVLPSGAMVDTAMRRGAERVLALAERLR